MPITASLGQSLSDDAPLLPGQRRLSVPRLAATGSITAAVLFAFCWAAAYVVPGSATHRYIEMFTRAEMRSGAALAEGVCWSLLGGLVVGAVVALVYNALEALERR